HRADAHEEARTSAMETGVMEPPATVPPVAAVPRSGIARHYGEEQEANREQARQPPCPHRMHLVPIRRAGVLACSPGRLTWLSARGGSRRDVCLRCARGRYRNS